MDPFLLSHSGNGGIALDQIINMYKPVGWTSFDIVRRLKHRRPLEKIGHAGTLDPFAEGVLLICTGKATKQVPELMAQEKEYTACIQLGAETDTLDITGSLIQEKKVQWLATDHIQGVLQTFVGTHAQVPPKYSALKQEGKRFYEIMRRGADVAPTSRMITIHKLEWLDASRSDRLTIRIVCSKGTFIRALARDLAYALDTVGYVRSLLRTRIGPYRVDQSVRIDQWDG